MVGEMIRTKAGIYILPMLGKDREFYGFYKELMNVYMFEESYPGIDGYIYLLYRIKEDKFDGSTLGRRLVMHDYYIGYYTISTGPGYSMVVLQLPDNYGHEIKLFWEGKFSQFTEFYKMTVLSFHDAIENSLLHGILDKKTKTKKDLERRLSEKTSKVRVPNGMDLDSKPLITTETFFFKDLTKFEIEQKEKLCNSIHSDSTVVPALMSKRQRQKPGTTN